MYIKVQYLHIGPSCFQTPKHFPCLETKNKSLPSNICASMEEDQRKNIVNIIFLFKDLINKLTT